MACRLLFAALLSGLAALRPVHKLNSLQPIKTVGFSLAIAIAIDTCRDDNTKDDFVSCIDFANGAGEGSGFCTVRCDATSSCADAFKFTPFMCDPEWPDNVADPCLLHCASWHEQWFNDAMESYVCRTSEIVQRCHGIVEIICSDMGSSWQSLCDGKSVNWNVQAVNKGAYPNDVLFSEAYLGRGPTVTIYDICRNCTHSRVVEGVTIRDNSAPLPR